MLTKEQLKEIASRPTKDVLDLLLHIEELTKFVCEHEYVYFFEKGFECAKCKKRKGKL
jgi:hypothetical protein